MIETRKQAIEFLRQKYGRRIKFSSTMDKNIPELETGQGIAKTYIFIVMIDSQMFQCHVGAKGEVNVYPDYQLEHQSLAEDWE